MIRVLVVDDEAPARAKLRLWLGEYPGVQLVGEAADGVEAAACIEAQQPDLVLLDIQMPGLSGLEVAAQLDGESAPLIVFVTAHDEFAVRAFELDAVDYLLKPFDRDRFTTTLARVVERLGTQPSRHPQAVHSARQLQQARGPLTRLLVPARGTFEVIDTAAIHWIEADDNYVHIHVDAQSFMLRRPLRELLLQLDARRFVRVHKSSAVNVAAIRSLEPLFKGDFDVLLHDGRSVRMSRRYAPTVLALLGN